MIAKKMLLLAAMALAAAALMAPAAHGEWTHEGKPLVGTGTFELSGSVKLSVSGVNTYECAVLMEMTILSGAEGKGSINTFEPAAATCKGTGVVKGCELESYNTGASMPWGIDAVVDAKASLVTVEYKFKKGCAVPNAHVEFKEVTMTPDNVNQISSFTLSGSEGPPSNTKLSGTVFLTSKAKTYGIK